jgi:hypothetical protein
MGPPIHLKLVMYFGRERVDRVVFTELDQIDGGASHASHIKENVISGLCAMANLM